MPLCTCSILACPKDCSCGLEQKGRRQIFCNHGGMDGPIPVKQFDPDLEVTLPLYYISLIISGLLVLDDCIQKLYAVGL